ncbi:MAG TPA: hypothetical protein VMU43_03190 [Candidatus Acidoferrum sp.]|nr:hypothetical protein [Candidatus Acidoferrum sp.]
MRGQRGSKWIRRRVILGATVILAIGIGASLAGASHPAKSGQAGNAASEEEQNPTNVRSRVTIYDLAAKKTHVVFTDDKLWEAPNWSRDGKYLLVNSGGVLYQLALHGDAPATPEKIALPEGYVCNNDKGYSPDGKRLAFSAIHGGAKSSQVYIASADGANPRLMTLNMPSYFHGWSPGGRLFAFVAERNGAPFHLYRMSASGGEEEALTSQPVFDDGPDYSPDGKWIYFNSKRINGWDIWRIPPSGAGPNDERAERVTSDAMEDWFPHPSPNGKWLVFLSFPPGTPGHNAKTQVELRMIPMPSSAPGLKPENAKIVVLERFFGGQGTINVNSWSPDSKKFAYVSYERLEK